MHDRVEFDAVEVTAEEPEAVQAQGAPNAKPDDPEPVEGRPEPGKDVDPGHATAEGAIGAPAAGGGGDEPSVTSAAAEAPENPLSAENPARPLAGAGKAKLSRVSEGFRKGLERALSDRQAILDAIANTQRRSR